MNTDLDRLHAFSLGEIFPTRGSGKTFHSCQLIAGAIGVGCNPIMVVLPQMRWTNHVVPMLVDILLEQGMDPYPNGEEALLVYLDMSTPPSHVRFIPQSMKDKYLIGLGPDAAIVDMSYE